MPVAAVQVHLDAQSMRHAWHAELWGDRLPVRAGVDPDALTRPVAGDGGGVRRARRGGAGRRARVDVAAGRRTPCRVRGRCPAWPGCTGSCCPALVTTYTRHLRVVAPVADGPVRRALRLVVRDEVEDWMAGERLVQRLVTRPHDVAAVYGFQQRLESVAVAAGAHSGLVELPDWVPAD